MHIYIHIPPFRKPIQTQNKTTGPPEALRRGEEGRAEGTEIPMIGRLLGVGVGERVFGIWDICLSVCARLLYLLLINSSASTHPP